MDKIFKWGRRAGTLIPGLVVIFKNLWLPREISHLVIGGVLQAIGVMTLIVFEINNKRSTVKSLKSHRNKAIFFLMIFILTFFCYIKIYDSQVVYNNKYDTTILIPFWKSDELYFMIAKSSSAESAISSYGPEAIREAIQENIMGFTVTKILFIIVYISIFESLIVAFSFIALDNELKI